MNTCTRRSGSVRKNTSSATALRSVTIARSDPELPAARNARLIMSPKLACARSNCTDPFSNTLRSSRSSSNRVSRIASVWIIPACRVTVCAEDCPSISNSEKARIDVIGVRNSWLIWLRNASFCTDTCVSFSFASRKATAARDSSICCASSRPEYSMIWADSLATAIRSSTDTLSRPTSSLIMACAVAAPTDPANLPSSRSTNSGVASGK